MSPPSISEDLSASEPANTSAPEVPGVSVPTENVPEVSGVSLPTDTLVLPAPDQNVSAPDNNAPASATSSSVCLECFNCFLG